MITRELFTNNPDRLFIITKEDNNLVFTRVQVDVESLASTPKKAFELLEEKFDVSDIYIKSADDGEEVPYLFDCAVMLDAHGNIYVMLSSDLIEDAPQVLSSVEYNNSKYLSPILIK